MSLSEPQQASVSHTEPKGVKMTRSKPQEANVSHNEP